MAPPPPAAVCGISLFVQGETPSRPIVMIVSRSASA